MIGSRPAVLTPAAPRRRPRLTFLRLSLAAFALLTLAGWLTILYELTVLAGERAASFAPDRLLSFGQELLGIGAAETPVFLQWLAWQNTFGLAVETLAMSVLATAFAAAFVLPTMIFAARNVAFGSLRLGPSPVWPVVFFAIRAGYLVTRSLPELIWAMLIIFVFSPGIVPGAIALGLHNLGILGKLAADVVEDVDARPLRALQRAGAGPVQIMAYGLLPAVLPRFVTYLLYRWEVIIRTTIVVGFVGAGGLGREFRLSMSWFQYPEVTLILLVYFCLVIGVDLASAGLRRLAR